jgi:hypothetical protein
MLAAPASQKLYPYHDCPSLLCIYAAYGSSAARLLLSRAAPTSKISLESWT